MATTTYWTGGTGNWITDANWSGSAPADTNIAIFDGRSVVAVVAGMEADESGATGAGALATLHFKEEYTGDVGVAPTTGNDDGIPLCIHADKIIIEGPGTYHIVVGKDDQTTDANIDYIIVNNKDATVYLYSYTNDGTNTAHIQNLYVLAGTVYLSRMVVLNTKDAAFTVASDCYVANLHLLPRGNKASTVAVTVAEGCYKINGAVPTDLNMKDGTITTDSSLGTVFMSGGTLNIGSDGAAISLDQNITEIIAHGGTINWYPDDDSNDSYIGQLLLAGAKLDASGTRNPDRTKVLGSGADKDIVIAEAGELNIKNGRSNISLAASSEAINFGGVTETDVARISATVGVLLGLDLEHA